MEIEGFLKMWGAHPFSFYFLKGLRIWGLEAAKQSPTGCLGAGLCSRSFWVEIKTKTWGRGNLWKGAPTVIFMVKSHKDSIG